ncbi:MAG: transposase [Clostridia bacterium]|nr:transposase [Clostridia bacterium]
MHLSFYGKVVEKHITGISKTYSHIFIDNYAIMPNHIHLLVMVYSDENALKEKNSDSPQNAEIPKLISTLKRLVNRDIGQNVWQRSYHDHIIRNETSYNGIWEYIEHNASKWKDDCFYTK